MAQCTTDNTKLFGRAVILEVADGCADTIPAESEFMLLAAGTSKTFDMNPNTTNSSADDTKGWVENVVTSNDLTLSFEGEVRVNDKSDQYGVYKFIKYYVNEVNAARQPTLWVRMYFGQIMIQAYMVITALSNDGGTDDIVTFSTEFKVADGSTVSIDDIDDTVAVTGVTVAPTSSTIAAGSSTTFSVTIAPQNATNQAFTVTSSLPARATATISGNTVTVSAPSGATAGTATITVTTDDGSFTTTHTATVTAA
ncbi:phage tail tube protein [Tatumella citrea]|uniref:DNA breaking-rejoining protein n=1 Tax=Tatumella citrea TaxID=53336 RepID=A0A1Y0LA81_TATCI|nr:phage tail tube protein [Tatumella citrea]ARU94559.1 DNA breaking-rejoining protein [Tatumella citrea]ARU98597.1 DNA breaking-rejoining protein [Tatumella citrea]